MHSLVFFATRQCRLVDHWSHNLSTEPNVKQSFHITTSIANNMMFSSSNKMMTALFLTACAMQQMCSTNAIYGPCPNGYIHCLDGSCAPQNVGCPAPQLPSLCGPAEQYCYGNCIPDNEVCESVPPEFDTCPDGFYPCPDGSCRGLTQTCPTDTLCPVGQMPCPDGSCVFFWRAVQSASRTSRERLEGQYRSYEVKGTVLF